MMIARKPYPSDVSDEEWALAVPYLTLLPETAGQRTHLLREAFNGLRYVVRHGIPWRAMPHDLPPWHAVYDQAMRWLRAGCFEMLAHDLRAVLRLAAGRGEEPSAAILDSRTLRSTPESGARAGWDGHKRTRGSKLHLAVDTLGHLLALRGRLRSRCGSGQRGHTRAGSAVQRGATLAGGTSCGRRRAGPSSAISAPGRP
jgi:transposase